MRRLLCLLLLLAACKSSTTSEKERIEKKERKENRIAVITAKVLEGNADAAYHTEHFAGDIDQIAEITDTQSRLSDGFLKKDTTRRTYFFNKGYLHQVAESSHRMKRDTLTIHYDAGWNVRSLIYSDARETYRTEHFKYDNTGRRIEQSYRFWGVKAKSDYQYNKAGDTITVKRILEANADQELISITAQGDDIIVKRQSSFGNSAAGMTIVETYNSDNLQIAVANYLGGVLYDKVLRTYDKHGNAVKWERHTADLTAKDSVGGVDAVQSYNITYQYDREDNWISKTAQRYDSAVTTVIKRKIVYK